MPLKAMKRHGRRKAAVSLLLAVLASASAAHAFSQIGAEDGSSTQKEGIVSVPLPPLPDTPPAEAAADPAGPASEETPATTGGAPSPSPGVPTPSGGATAPVSGVPTSAAPSTTPDTSPSASPPPASLPSTPAPSASPPEDPVAPAASETAVTPPEEPEPSAPEGTDAAEEAVPGPGQAAEPSLPPAEVFYGEEGLPGPVRDLRAKLMEVARTGEIERLRPYLETGEEPTTVSFGGTDEDPIDYLKSASGDGEGVEVLAILLEILEGGHIRNEPATDNEIFVWPYFPGVPIDALTAPRKVELFEIVTAGDYQEMLAFGAYNFYRAGISPDGRLQFFVAGD